MSNKFIKFITFFSLLLGGLVLAFGVVHAGQIDVGLTPVNNAIGLSSEDPRILIARIISIGLGLLGAVAVILVLYGGFLWMTAGGDQTKIDHARGWLINAGIGLVIVLSSWAITTFVLNRLLEATGAVNRVNGPPPICVGAGCFTPPGGNLFGFYVLGISPKNPAPQQKYPMNSIVRILFNEPVDPTTVCDSIHIRVSGDTVPMPCSPRVGEHPVFDAPNGFIDVSDSLVSFVPTRSCEPWDDPQDRCFRADTNYTVTIDEGEVRSAISPFRSLNCGGGTLGGDNDCTAEFSVGNYIDTRDPEVVITQPTNGQSVEVGVSEIMSATVNDDSGVSLVEFFDNNARAGSVMPSAGTVFPFNAEISNWVIPGESQSCRKVYAVAHDIDNHNRQSGEVTAVVRPTHCFNGAQDGDETGLDCGGTAGNADYCGKCAGESCTVAPANCSLSCRSAACENGICIDLPFIRNVDPSVNGVVTVGPGSFITITGEFFGTAGRVMFLGNINDPTDDVEASLASCNEIASWIPTRVIIQVPEKAVQGPISLETSVGKDRSDDGRGWIGTVDPTRSLLPPGLCGLAPSSGRNGTSIRIIGTRFGAVQGTRDIFSFTRGTQSPISGVVTSWTPTVIVGMVPEVGPGFSNVKVHVNGLVSNAVPFVVIGPEAGTQPIITSISPTSGPAGTYVTISGSNFGSQQGNVVFTKKSEIDLWANGSTDFPAGCNINYWTNNQIIVKVPSAYNTSPVVPVAEEAHDVTIRRGGASPANSASTPFQITSGTPGPGVCAVNPASGPENSLVTFLGERFGDISNTLGKFFSGAVTDANVPIMINSSAPSFVSGSEARVRVPVGAKTGPATVEVGGVAANNSVNFRVFDCRNASDGCNSVGSNLECCGNGTCSALCQNTITSAGFAWYFSTGPVPRVPTLLYECSAGLDGSPSPWGDRVGGTNACVNALVVGRFSLRMDSTTINSNTVKVYHCTSTGDDPCSTKDSVLANAVDGITTSDWSDQPPGVRQGSEFRFTPATALLPDTWYKVELSTAIKANESGYQFLLEDSACGSGLAYCWKFKTRAADVNQGICRAGSVLVNPAQKTIIEDNAQADYDASVQAQGDSCITINGSDYNYNWTMGVVNGSISNSYAQVVQNTVDRFKAIVTALEETPSGLPTLVVVNIPEERINSSGQLTIDFTDPEIVKEWPDCNGACINADIGAEFNTAMDAESLTAEGAVTVWKCGNESCSWFLDIVDGVVVSQDITDPANPSNLLLNRKFIFDPNPDLSPNTYYKVIVSREITSESGVPLSERYSQNYSWIFKTKIDALPCGVARVEMRPESARVGVVGARVVYNAVPFGAPDECSREGQELVASSYNWGWTSADHLVATLVNNGEVDTTRNLPAGCSSLCLNTGASGQDGVDAVCGDDVLEPTLGEECDNGDVAPGDGCSPVCLNEGSDADGTSYGATCGNGGSCNPTPGIIGHCADALAAACGGRAGSCAPGVDCVSDCSATETCTDQGFCVEEFEDCDDGNILDGDGCSSHCLNEGSSAARGVVCSGDGLGIGEDCDDGSRGCSGMCLRTGSHPEPFSLCGNNVQESGEDCDDDNNLDGDGCSSRCLNEGANPSQCGNNTTELGEDCDDHNNLDGDGCSARCLKEGASIFYETASFCGNGALETGEECEATTTSGDNKIDARQIAEAIGIGGVVAGLQTTEIQAQATTESAPPGVATFGLQCGFSSDNECRVGRGNGIFVSSPITHGVGENGCCSARPQVSSKMPTGNSVCRNALIKVVFNSAMDLGSFERNILVARADSVCVLPETALPASGAISLSTSAPVAIFENTFFGNLSGLYKKVANFVGNFIPVVFAVDYDTPRLVPAWCAGAVEGMVRGIESSVNSSTLLFELKDVLEPHTWYRVRVVGDVPGIASDVDGVKSALGVGMNGDYQWEFHTRGAVGGTPNDGVCEVNEVRVSDTAADPSVFTKPNYVHNFTAQALSINPDFGTEEIAPIPGIYSWNWNSWRLRNNIVTNVSPPTPASTAAIKSGTVNGESTVTAELEISVDTIHSITETTRGKKIHGSLDTEVFICENPWPGTPAVPSSFVDAPTIYGINFGLTETTTSRYGNFQTRYCRDFGATSTADDLPALSGPVTSTVPGTLREFVFRNGADVIGFKIMENPRHISPTQWYRERFTDSPEPTTVNGWQAVRRGNTIYISAANYNTQLYSNIYVVSYNEGASAETKVIYDQLISNLRYLVNVPGSLNSGLCNLGSTGTGDTVTTTGGIAVTCSNDQECLVHSSNSYSYCNAFDDKVKRDLVRLADFRTIESTIIAHDSIPQLDSGTFVRSHTTSAWPSWLETFSTELGTMMPVDPINKFYGCQKTCSSTNVACNESSDCQAGQTCQGFASDSCYNSNYGTTTGSTAAYRCPKGSLVYQYHSLGDALSLETDLENSHFSWGTFVPFSASSGIEFVVGNNNGSSRVCQSVVRGSAGVCGDGVVGVSPFEFCERGQTATKTCSSVGVAGNGTISAVCKNDCTGFEAASDATCVQSYCGDGIVQSPNGATPPVNEICDDGANNGRYGYCNTTCTAPGSHCGDSVLAGTEQCDRGGVLNGQWQRNRADSCASDCTIPGPYCGNGVVDDSREQCDGNITYGKGLCVIAGGQNTVANSQAECTAKGGTTYTPCPSRAADGFTYQTEQVMPCGTATDNCAFVEPTPACEVVGSCGNGVKDGTEECDDHNNNNTDSCTEDCKLNICGDEFPYTGVEDCDFGRAHCSNSAITSCTVDSDCSGRCVGNGRPCDAAYGSSCNYCSTNCRYVTQAGAFCGDGIHTPGAEQCDFSADPIFATPALAPVGYIAGQSRCGRSCDKVCPNDFDDTIMRFVPSSTSTTFDISGEAKEISIPACRLAEGMSFDINFGSGVVYFPAPMDVLLVIDVSGSMNIGSTRSRMDKLRNALCGNDLCGSIDEGSGLDKIYKSRPGQVRIGVVTYSSQANYVSYLNGTRAGGDCFTGGTTGYPCLTRDMYFGSGGAADPSLNFTAPAVGSWNSGFISEARKRELQRIIYGLSPDGGTASYTGMAMANKIMTADAAAGSRIVIFMGDGLSEDCCEYGLDSRAGCYLEPQRSHCVGNNEATCTVNRNYAGPIPRDLQDAACLAGAAADRSRGADSREFCDEQEELGLCEWSENGFCHPNPDYTDVTECEQTQMQANKMNRQGDGVYVFTAGFPNAATGTAMAPWSEQGNPGITFAYPCQEGSTGSCRSGSTSVSDMFAQIVESIGVKITLSNNENFSDIGNLEVGTPNIPNWTESVTIPGPKSGVLLPIPTVNYDDRCVNRTITGRIKAEYGSTNTTTDTVTVSEPKWKICPLSEF